MKNIVSVFAAVLSLFCAAACLQNGVANSSEKSVVKPVAGNANSNDSSTAAGAGRANPVSPSPPVTETQTNKDLPKTAAVNHIPADESDLQKQITDNLGGLVVATFYQPHLIEGDFNGDHLTDAAIVVGAEDRTSEQTNAIGDLFVGLPYIAEGVSFQNLRTNASLLAKPKQSAMDIEKYKARLKPASKLGLLIILSGGNGAKAGGDGDNWKAELSKTDYDKKFLLLDVLFGGDSENRADKTEWLSTVQRGENCLPAVAKGEGIFSGDAQSAGKVIYFNGRNFAWTQCGE